MGDIITRIIADKEGFIADLQGRADYDRSVANDEKSTLSQKERFRSRGRAEGLELAIILIKGWELPS